MIEAIWRKSNDWRPMLEHLIGRIDERIGTLYVCAGLRCIWELLYDGASRKAVEVAEQAANGDFNEAAHAAHWAECPTFGYDFDARFIREHMADGNYSASVRRLFEMGVFSEADIRCGERLGDEEVVRRLSDTAHVAYHCVSGGNLGINSDGLSEHILRHMSRLQEWPGGWLVREIFGNPFRPVTIAPEWRTETALAIARGAYSERAFDRLPILADALEEAGCDASELLVHCRKPGTHVLGCWALDAVLNLRQ